MIYFLNIIIIIYLKEYFGDYHIKEIYFQIIKHKFEDFIGDFSKINFDNLFQALNQADKTFAYKHKMKDDYCSLSKITLDDITKEEQK